MFNVIGPWQTRPTRSYCDPQHGQNQPSKSPGPPGGTQPLFVHKPHHGHETALIILQNPVRDSRAGVPQQI